MSTPLSARLARRALLAKAVVRSRPDDVPEDLAQIVARMCLEPEKALALVSAIRKTPRLPLDKLRQVTQALDRSTPARKLSHEAFEAIFEVALGGRAGDPIPGGKPLCADTQLALERSSGGR